VKIDYSYLIARNAREVVDVFRPFHVAGDGHYIYVPFLVFLLVICADAICHSV